jgi:general secretion pathway protein M
MNLSALKSISFKSFKLPFNLQRRDRIAIMAAAAALVLFIVIQLIIAPIFDRRTQLRQLLQVKTRNLQEIKTLAVEYENAARNFQGSEEMLRQRPRGFTLFSFLDSLAGTGGIKQNIVYMKPSTTNLRSSPYTLSMVEMKIQSLTMQQLVNFLHGVEVSSQMVHVKRMSIAKDDKDQNLITAVLQVETYQL